jgi:hypothetical protein
MVSLSNRTITRYEATRGAFVDIIVSWRAEFVNTGLLGGNDEPKGQKIVLRLYYDKIVVFT